MPVKGNFLSVIIGLNANPCCYVWLYCSWFFVFDCICAVLRGSLLYHGLSAVKPGYGLHIGCVFQGHRRGVVGYRNTPQLRSIA